MKILHSIYNNMLFHFEGLKSGDGKRIGGNCKPVSILKPIVKGISFLLIA